MILFDPIGRSAKKIVQNDHLRSADRADEIGTLPELLEIGQPGDHAPDQEETRISRKSNKIPKIENPSARTIAQTNSRARMSQCS